jgi:methionyl-tRNA formyltransferase
MGISGTHPLRVVFMGTPAFALPVLSALLDAGHQVVGVYTQPDRPAGRGKKTIPTEVKAFALEGALPVFQPKSLRRDEAARRELASLSPELIVIAAYGLFLPAEVLALPRLGCLNVHPSLLPRYRGPSPVASAILNGDAVTGVTIMQPDEGMDSGPIVAQRETHIYSDETTENLTLRLFQMGAILLAEILPAWERGEITPRPQDSSQATTTKLLSREDGEIDWSRSAAYIARQVRAYYPWPGCFTHWRGALLKVLEARVGVQGTGYGGVPRTLYPGEVVALPEGGVGVVTGDGILELRQVQLEGRRAVGVKEFISGHQDFIGARLS